MFHDSEKVCIFATSNKKKEKKRMEKKVIMYDSKFVNQNFRIKVFGRNAEGKKINTLVGFSGCLSLIGEELMQKFIKRSLESMDDVCVCKLRRGLQVSFYVK